MAITDFVSNVLTRYTADTSEMKAALRGLQADQKALAEAELAAAEARNAQLEGWINGLGKITFAFGGALAAGKILFDGYRDGIQDARAQAAAWWIDIDKLKTASHGLVTENELLAFAAKTANSAFRNSEADLITAQKAMYALTQQGRDHADVTEKVTTAIQSLKVKGLTDLGIYVDTSSVKLDAAGNVIDNYSNKLELHKRIMEALAAKAGEVSDAQDGIGDSVARSAVKLQDSWDDLKKGLGQLVTAMQPLLDALATAVGLVAKIADASMKDVGGPELARMLAAASGGKLTEAQIQKQYGFGQGAGLMGDGGFGKVMGSFDYLNNGGALGDITNVQGSAIVATFKNYAIGEFGKLQDWMHEEGKKPVHPQHVARIRDGMNQWLDHLIEMSSEMNAKVLDEAERKIHALRLAGATAHDADTRSMDQKGAGAGFTVSGMDGQFSLPDSDALTANAERQTLLQKTFGPVGDFDIYQKAFASLEGAVGSAYEAFVTGGESAGKAFKKFVGEAALSLGKQMSIEALKNTAYAIASLVPGPFFNPAAAGGYAIAAAEFAAGAVVAGVVASELGAGSSSTPTKGGGGVGGGAGSGGGSGSGGGGSGSSGQQQKIIVIGESFAEDTPRMRALKAKRYVSLANGGDGYSDD